jgi:hypothetical protein
MAGIFLAAMSTPAWARIPAQPGTINYVEGQASIGPQRLGPKSAGSALLGDNQALETGKGKAEILLTPGVYLRVGNNSSVQMISSSLTDTGVGVQRGRAMVEVDETHKENNLWVREDGSSTRLLKTGLYDFDANSGQVRVFDGQAVVSVGDHQIKLKGSHEITLANAPLKAQKFDKKSYEADLYAWSSLRSSYLAEANAETAQTFVVNGGWYGPGWYWDPWFYGYTFLPGDYFASPFGWGFYSPIWFYGGGFYGGFPGYGYHGYRHFAPHEGGHRWIGRAPGIRGGGIRGGGFHAGGFHGGMHR